MNFVSSDGEYATKDCASCGKEIKQQRVSKAFPEFRKISPKFTSWEQVSKYCRQCYKNGIKEAVEYYDGRRNKK